MEQHKNGGHNPFIELQRAEREQDDADLAGASMRRDQAEPGSHGHECSTAQIGRIVADPPAQNRRAGVITSEGHTHTSPPRAVSRPADARTEGAWGYQPVPVKNFVNFTSVG